MKNLQIRAFLFALSILMIALLGATPLRAQCDSDPAIRNVLADVNDDRVQVRLNYEIDWKGSHKDKIPNAEDETVWHIISPTLIQKAKAATDPVTRAGFYEMATPAIDEAKIDGSRAVILQTATALLRGEKYVVSLAEQNGFIEPKCVEAAIAITILSGSTADTAKKEPQIVVAPVEKRDDAEIYIEGLLEGAHKEKATYTIDATVKKAMPYNEEDPETFWEPFFNIKASTSEDADPDSINFGVNFENPISVGSNGLGIKRLYFSEAAKFEADRNFKNVNFVGDFRVQFVSKHLNRWGFNLVPFVGIEVGKNLKSPLAEAEGQGIARPIFGANFYSKLYSWDSDKYSKVLSFETLYERRFPLTGEIAFNDDDDGNPIPLHVTRAPRDYVKSSLIYDFTKNFGFKLNYEYGSLPPSFKFVDSKFSVGLVFKGVFKKQ